MIQNTYGVTLYTENPMWINDEGEYKWLQNTYDNKNIVCVDYKDSSHHQEYNIGKNYTIIPEKALLLFKDQNEAIKYNSLLENDEGRHLFLYNFFVENREIATPLPRNCHDIESGLYCLDQYDKRMSHMCKLEELDEIRYFDAWKLSPFEMKTRKPKVIDSNSVFGKFCLSQLDIPVEQDEHDHEIKLHYRVFFEVYNEEDAKVFRTFKIYADSETGIFHRFSELNGYPMFFNLESALKFRNKMRAYNNIWENTIGSIYIGIRAAKEYKDECDKRRNRIIGAVQFLLSHASQIYAGVKFFTSGQFGSTIKGLTKGGETPDAPADVPVA